MLRLSISVIIAPQMAAEGRALTPPSPADEMSRTTVSIVLPKKVDLLVADGLAGRRQLGKIHSQHRHQAMTSEVVVEIE